MSGAERWARVKAVFDEAVITPPGARASLLRDRCAQDPGLLAEVESLLAADAERGSVLDRPAETPLVAQALAAMHEELGDRVPALAAGHRFGPYAITDFLGAGGMGEVYRADDTSLGREVAVKMLPRHWMDHSEHRARFEREARVLASLNHPNIGAIYGIEEHAGTRGLVLELIEGETLAQRVDRQRTRAGGARGLALTDALSIAVQIARALEAAHERAIVHRDLKPANIKITPHGQVKVLDFGVAKAIGETGDGSLDAARDRARVSAVLGTAPYMSPEQGRGDAVDRRSDIWAFGCVLYEMLCGSQAFDVVASEVLVADTARCTPDLARLPRETPAVVRRLLARCLEEDRTKRLEHVAIARYEIEEVHAAPSGRETVRPGPRRQFLQRCSGSASASPCLPCGRLPGAARSARSPTVP